MQRKAEQPSTTMGSFDKGNPRMAQMAAGSAAHHDSGKQSVATLGQQMLTRWTIWQGLVQALQQAYNKPGNLPR